MPVIVTSFHSADQRTITGMICTYAARRASVISDYRHKCRYIAPRIRGQPELYHRARAFAGSAPDQAVQPARAAPAK